MVKAAIRKSPVSPSAAAVHKVRQMDEEQLEMRLYLSKLRQLVPNMPKNRKVSKVEVINNVIDYICDLQSALIDQLHQGPSDSSSAIDVDVASAVAASIINNNSMEVVDANPVRSSAVSC